jgi:hypothetical protein
MTTAHTIAVPVEALDIVAAPGRKKMQQYEDAGASDSASNTNSFVITLTLRTPASRVTFRRQVTIYWVSIWNDDENDAPSADEYAHFRCILGGQQFDGAFNLRTRQGKLTAYTPSSS